MVPQNPHGEAGIAKLTDFGVARLVGDDPLTRTGDVVGTLAYMAPEQAEGEESGAEADLYSLGLVLYEAFTGVNPVRGGGPAATARRLGEPLPPVRRLRRDLPRELCRCPGRGRAPRPDERGSVAGLRAALAEAVRRCGRRDRDGRRPARSRWSAPTPQASVAPPARAAAAAHRGLGAAPGTVPYPGGAPRPTPPGEPAVDPGGEPAACPGGQAPALAPAPPRRRRTVLERVVSALGAAG